MLLCAQNGIHYLQLPVMFLIYSSCWSNDYCHSAFFYLIINIQKKKYLFFSLCFFFLLAVAGTENFSKPQQQQIALEECIIFFRLACNIITCITFNLLDFYRCAIQMDVSLTPGVMNICFLLAYFSSFLWWLFLDGN